jgi:hypothetical protein
MSTAHGERAYSFTPARDSHDPHSRCTYCGSLTVADAIKAMQTPGTHYSGSDWKYGWPHKFYIEIPCEPHEYEAGTKVEAGQLMRLFSSRSFLYRKFYTTHLLDATPEQFADFSILSREFFGITWSLRTNEQGVRDIYFIAPPGIQHYGIVGQPNDSYAQCKSCGRRVPTSMMAVDTEFCTECNGRFSWLNHV